MQSQARQLRAQDAKELAVRYKVPSRFYRSKVKPRQIVNAFNPASIVKGLNERPNSPATKRVSRFIHLFNRARILNDSFRLFFESKDDMDRFLDDSLSGSMYKPKEIFGTCWSFKIPEMQALNDQLNRVLIELNNLGRRYRWHPLIRHMGYEVGGDAAFNITERWDVKDLELEWETRAIWWLCGNNGRWIDVFRQCRDCSRWFFALAEHQVYCGDACRKRDASCSEKFKQRRRLYMRKYRSAEKARDVNAKKLARGK
jgi:hypothetical protein